MDIVPYTEEHLDAVRRVCIQSAGKRAREDEVHARFTHLMYCDPYLEHGVAYLLLDEEGEAVGYVLACEDWERFEPAFAPYRARIESLGPDYARRVDEEASFYASVSRDFPAHLHIDILPAYTGRGFGRALMETLLARLSRDHVRGVIFGVASSNTRAVGFYRHLGRR